MEIFGGICPGCGRETINCICEEETATNDSSNNTEETSTAIDDCLNSIAEVNDKALYPTDLKEAVIGMVTRFGMDPLVLLDREKCIGIFMNRDGMSREDAEEFYEYNVIGAWLGDGTPCYAVLAEESTKASSRFFQNKKCEYFPCHKTKELNCLFCFCPLYTFSNCGGNAKYTERGTKDCSGCTLPHSNDGYIAVMDKLKNK